LVVVAVPFALIAGSWIAAISINNGRLIVSDSGRINYILWVNHTSPGWYFQDPGTARGTYLHPVRKVHGSPAIYEFATPLKGTQPIWYDPSYWTTGVYPRILYAPWLSHIVQQLRAYAGMVIRGQWVLIAGFVLVAAVSRRLLWRDARWMWMIWGPAVACLAMYAAILAEPRYVAVFFIVIWTGLFAALRRPKGHTNEWRNAAAAGIACVSLVASLSISTGRQARNAQSSPDVHRELAARLSSYGVREGDRVARIGGLFAASWARLLRVTVVAEMPGSDTSLFWSAAQGEREDALNCFRKLGVRAVVAERVEPLAPFATGAGWLSGGSNQFAVLLLR